MGYIGWINSGVIQTISSGTSPKRSKCQRGKSLLCIHYISRYGIFVLIGFYKKSYSDLMVTCYNPFLSLVRVPLHTSSHHGVDHCSNCHFLKCWAKNSRIGIASS